MLRGLLSLTRVLLLRLALATPKAQALAELLGRSLSLEPNEEVPLITYCCHYIQDIVILTLYHIFMAFSNILYIDIYI